MEDNSDSFAEMNPNVSRETIDQLKDYRELIINEKSNLISNNDKKSLWIRHFHDSMRIIDLFSFKNSQIIDIGTGAGLPGIPIALSLKNTANQIYLCESRKKKINFLLKCKKQLELDNVEVIHERVENVKQKKFDYIIGRAVTQLNPFFQCVTILHKKKLFSYFIKVYILIKSLTMLLNIGILSIIYLKIIEKRDLILLR